MTNPSEAAFSHGKARVLTAVATHSAQPAEPAPTTSRHWLAVTVLLVALAKLAWLLGDPVLRTFMGDSASYLHAALTDWIPPDRSFLYPWLLAGTAVHWHSHLLLIGLQSAAGAACALLLAAILRRRFSVRPWLCVLAALLFALDPAQVFYERMLMAESVGLLLFLLHFLALMEFVRTRHAGWMAGAAVLGILAVAFRLSLLPTVWGLAITAPVLAAFGGPRLAPVPRLLAIARLWVLGVALTALAHAGYMHVYGRLAQAPAGYIAASGMMRVGLLAPLVGPEDFAGSGVDPSVLDQVKLDLRDRDLREAQIWSPGGLYQTLQAHSSDPERAARVITTNALRRQPLRLVDLGLQTTRDYLNPGVRDSRLQDELGRRPPDEGTLRDLALALGYDARGVAGSDSGATRWFVVGTPWLIACLFALPPLALAMLAAGWKRPDFRLRLLLCLASLGLVASQVLFSHIVSIRYLHPLPWFVLANLALLLDAPNRRRRP